MSDERRRGNVEVDIVDLIRDTRAEILQQMREGFKGVHARQDKTNGRIDDLQEKSGEHEARLMTVERETDAFHLHRRATDPPPITPAKVDSEDKPVRRWDVYLALGVGAAVVGAWKFIQWVATGMKVGP